MQSDRIQSVYKHQRLFDIWRLIFSIVDFQVAEHKGETLKLDKISRLDMGIYICTANNGNEFQLQLNQPIENS